MDVFWSLSSPCAFPPGVGAPKKDGVRSEYISPLPAPVASCLYPYFGTNRLQSVVVSPSPSPSSFALESRAAFGHSQPGEAQGGMLSRGTHS